MSADTRKKAILFDVDDTLYDQTVPFKEAYREYFGADPAVPADVIYPVTRKYSDQCVKNLKIMRHYYNLDSALYSVESWKMGGDSLDCIETLFSIVDKDVTMFHISPFVKFAKPAAIIGYGCIIPQGRPLLSEILDIKNQEKPLSLEIASSILRICNKFKFLQPERYNESHISELVDFILQYSKIEQTQVIAIKALESLYSWFPVQIIGTKLEEIINGLISVLSYGYTKTNQAQTKEGEGGGEEKEFVPPDEIFRILNLSCDNLAIVSSRIFKNRCPQLCVITLAYALRGHKEATSAFERISSSCGMLTVGRSLKGKTDRYEVMHIFCQEMDPACLQIAIQTVNDSKSLLQIEAANIICCAVHDKVRCVDSGTHRCILSLLVNENPKIKCGALAALKRFPPPI